MTGQRLAIRLMVAQAALFAAETAAVHQLGGRLSVMQLALLRGIGGLGLVLCLAPDLRTTIRTRQLPLQLLRGLVSLLYLWVMMYSFTRMAFADATAISYTQVAYISLFSFLILREPVGPEGWLAAAAGIAGALLIAKPAFAGWNAVYLVALLGTGLNGLAFVLNRYLQREDSQTTTMFYTSAVAVAGNVPAVIFSGMPAAELSPWLMGVMILGPIGMYAGIVATRHAGAAALGPYTLLRLVIGVIGGVIFFREMPDMFSIGGGLLILTSCLAATCPPSERRKRPNRRGKAIEAT